MSTFKSMNPVASNVREKVMEEFLSQQQQLLSLLGNANKANLNKIKTGITISSWIKLKLGDTLRVVVYHNERHVMQAERVIKLLKK